ncbi:MAG: hypothetical protein ACRD2B_01170 [Terriglobia bacterium]
MVKNREAPSNPPSRIAGANAWGQAFGYDPWGNLTSVTVTQGSAPALSAGVNANNQLAGAPYSYDAAALRESLRRVALLASEQTHAVSLALNSDLLTLTTSGGDTGEASESLDAAFTGSPSRIGINASFLLDMLGVVKTGEVEIAFKDAESAVEIRPTDQATYHYRCVVMPMRL